MPTQEQLKAIVDSSINEAMDVSYGDGDDPQIHQAFDNAGQILLGALGRFQHVDSRGHVNTLVAVAPTDGGPGRAIIQLDSYAPGKHTLGLHWLVAALDPGESPIEALSSTGFTNDREAVIAACTLAGSKTYNEAHTRLLEGGLLPVYEAQRGSDFGDERQADLLERFIKFTGACVVDQELTDKCGKTLMQRLPAGLSADDQGGGRS